MHSIMKILTSEIAFWTAWIVIPLIMEIIPAIFGFAVLVKKRIKYRIDEEIKYFPEITLIIPVYNSEGTLQKCIDSVVNSSYPVNQMTIMLVNNGSRDNSFNIFTEYQKNHQGLKMKWMNAQQGKSKALNMALFNSDGKYIIHIDSDGVVEKDAIRNIVLRFESHNDIHCMTGSILTNPEEIDETQGVIRRIMRKVEFYEYAQAFLAGRNFASELDNIFTMSGAFSSFRKSTILKTQLYNTETVCEDTHVTFQIRKLLKKKIDICEKAIFFVDPIEDMGTLYVQRQRWQRGELEVAHMFPEKDNIVKGFFKSFMSRLLLFDHTFAFPRMIWYFALICLTFMNYPFSFVVKSVVVIYIFYTITTFLYYLNVCSYLTWNRKLFTYYARKVLIVFILPVFNFIVYWFRMAGIINSIKGESSWKTKSFKEECGICRDIIKNDFKLLTRIINAIKRIVVVEK